MNIDNELIANAKAFVEAATNLIGLLENNLNALYRIKDKVKLERQIKHVDELIRLFDELMFFNGVFITGFPPEYVMSLTAVDKLSHARDEPRVRNFEKSLDDFSRRFDKHAPHVRGLGSDLIILFRQAIKPRRSLIADYHSPKRKTISEKKLNAVRKQLSGIWPLGDRLYDIKIRLSTK